MDLKIRSFSGVSGKAVMEFQAAARAHRYDRDEVIEWSITTAWQVTTTGPFAWKRLRFGVIPASTKVVPFRVTGDEPQDITVSLSEAAMGELVGLQRVYKLASPSEALGVAASVSLYCGRRGHLTNGRTRINLR